MMRSPFQDREEEDSRVSCTDFLFEKTTFDDIAMGCYLYPNGKAYEDKNRAMGILVSRVISYLCMLGLMFVITYEISSSTPTSISLSTSQIVLSLASVVVCLILTTCSAVFTYHHFTSKKDCHFKPTAYVAWSLVGVLAHAIWVFSHVDLITYMVFYFFPSLAPSSLSPVPLLSSIAILRYVMAVSAWVEIQQALIPMRFTYTFYVTCAYGICHVVYHLLSDPNTTWPIHDGHTVNNINDKRWAFLFPLVGGFLVLIVSLLQIVCHGVMVRIAHARALDDDDTVDGFDMDLDDSFDEEFGGGGDDMTAHGRQFESQIDPHHGARLYQSAVVYLD